MHATEWIKNSCAFLMIAALISQPVSTLAQDHGSESADGTKKLVEIAPKSSTEVARHPLRVEDSPYLSHEQKVDLLRKEIKYVFVLFQENRSSDFYFGTYPGANGLFSQPAAQTPGFKQPIVTSSSISPRWPIFRTKLQRAAFGSAA